MKSIKTPFHHITLLIILSYTSILNAQSPPTIKEEVKKQELKIIETGPAKMLVKDNFKMAKEVNQEDQEALKSTYGFYGTYAMYDTWLPFKLGLLLSYGEKKGRLYELGYQKSSYGFKISGIELGNISDTKVYLSTRSHTWNGSFNFQYGFYYNAFDMNLGRTYLDSVGGNYDVIKIHTLGAMWSVGNRLDWSNGISFGIDWFRIFYPFKVIQSDSDYLDDTNNSENKEDIEEIIDTISNFPTFTFFNFEIGYRF
jgi:hypothetical protein